MFFSLFFFACDEQKKMPSAEFIGAYVELRLATEQYGTRPEAGLVRRDILQKYGLTREGFNAEADRIRSNFEIWNAFEDSVIAYMERFDPSASLEENENHAGSGPRLDSMTMRKMSKEYMRTMKMKERVAK